MLVGILLTILTLGVLQLGLAVYVRNVVHDAAVEGAYHAALADTSLAEGARRTADIVAARSARSTRPTSPSRDDRSRASAVRVTVRCPFPLVGLLGAPRRWR